MADQFYIGDKIKIKLQRLIDITHGIGSCYHCDYCGVWLSWNDFIYKKSHLSFECESCARIAVKTYKTDYAKSL